MDKKYKIVTVAFFILSVLFSVNSFAAASSMGMGSPGSMGMGPPMPCGGPFPPCPVPLDNGILLLLVVGLTFGGKKIYDSLKKNPA